MNNVLVSVHRLVASGVLARNFPSQSHLLWETWLLDRDVQCVGVLFCYL